MRITLYGSPCGPEILGDAPGADHRMSQALFCPGCGEVWARVARGPTWYSMAKWCGRQAQCENLYSVPGSFFGIMEGSTDAQAFLEFPAFLRREFEVQLRWAERRPIQGQPQSQGEPI